MVDLASSQHLPSAHVTFRVHQGDSGRVVSSGIRAIEKESVSSHSGLIPEPRLSAPIACIGRWQADRYHTLGCPKGMDVVVSEHGFENFHSSCNNISCIVSVYDHVSWWQKSQAPKFLLLECLELIMIEEYC